MELIFSILDKFAKISSSKCFQNEAIAKISFANFFYFCLASVVKDTPYMWFNFTDHRETLGRVFRVKGRVQVEFSYKISGVGTENFTGKSKMWRTFTIEPRISHYETSCSGYASLYFLHATYCCCFS